MCTKRIVGITAVRLAVAVSLILLLLMPMKVHAAGKVSISDKKVTLTVGEKYTVSLNNAEGTLKWKSGNTKIAKVGKKTGVITAISVGTCKITTNYNGKKYTCKLTVKTPEDSKGLPNSDLFERTILVIEKNETGELLPKDDSLKWKSEDKKTATVDNGTAKGIDYGFTRVTAKAADGKEYCCYVIVVAGSKFCGKTIVLDDLNEYGEVEKIKHPNDIGVNVFKNGKWLFNGQATLDGKLQFLNEYDEKEKKIATYRTNQNYQIDSVTIYDGNGKGKTSFTYSDGKLLSFGADIDSGFERQVAFYEDDRLNYIVDEKYGYEYYTKTNGQIFYTETDPKTGIMLYNGWSNMDGSACLETYDKETGNMMSLVWTYADGGSELETYDPQTNSKIGATILNADGSKSIEQYDSEHRMPVEILYYDLSGKLIKKGILVKETETGASYTTELCEEETNP